MGLLGAIRNVSAFSYDTVAPGAPARTRQAAPASRDHASPARGHAPTSYDSAWNRSGR